MEQNCHRGGLQLDPERFVVSGCEERFWSSSGTRNPSVWPSTAGPTPTSLLTHADLGPLCPPPGAKHHERGCKEPRSSGSKWESEMKRARRHPARLRSHFKEGNLHPKRQEHFNSSLK